MGVWTNIVWPARRAGFVSTIINIVASASVLRDFIFLERSKNSVSVSVSSEGGINVRGDLVVTFYIVTTNHYLGGHWLWDTWHFAVLAFGEFSLSYDITWHFPFFSKSAQLFPTWNFEGIASIACFLFLNIVEEEESHVYNGRTEAVVPRAASIVQLPSPLLKIKRNW